MKKVIILVFVIFFATGCSANYDLEIYNDEVRENMSYVSLDSSIWDSEVQFGFSYRDLVLSSHEYPYPAFDSTIVGEDDTIKLDDVEYYKNSLISESDKLGQKLEYKKFNLDNFNDSSIIKKCYKYFRIIEQDDEILFSTSLDNLCFDEYSLLDNITVNIKTNHKVVSSNADIVDGYHYTWNLNRSEKDDAAILLTIKKDEYIFNYENEFLKKIIYIGGFTGIILGVSGITYFYFKKKRKNLNEI